MIRKTILKISDIKIIFMQIKNSDKNKSVGMNVLRMAS